LSGPGDVVIEVAGKKLSVAPGQEMIVSNRMLGMEDHLKADGVGRRSFHTYALSSNLYVSECDVSIISLLNNVEHLKQLKHPKAATEKRLSAALLKTAASVEMITRYRGAYRARCLEAPSNSRSEFTPVNYAAD
jgi:hypothetical protein